MLVSNLLSGFVCYTWFLKYEVASGFTENSSFVSLSQKRSKQNCCSKYSTNLAVVFLVFNKVTFTYFVQLFFHFFNLLQNVCLIWKHKCRDLSMRTVTRKFARLYLTRKRNDNLEMHESERLIKGHRSCQQYCSTQLTQTTPTEKGPAQNRLH